MVEKKPELKSEINAYTIEVKRLTESLSEEKARESDLYSSIVESEAKVEHYQDICPPLTEAIQKTQDHLKMYKTEREKLNEDIKIK